MSTLFPTLVYSLCFATSSACAILLARSFLKARSRMLFWSALCFALLAVVNLLVIFDLVIFATQVNLKPLRLWLTVLAVGVLLFGFIWDEDA